MIFVFCGDILTTINRVVLFRFVTQGRIRIMTGAATERVTRERGCTVTLGTAGAGLGQADAGSWVQLRTD